MLIPGVTFLIIFSYLPMFGLVMAFQDFTPCAASKILLGGIKELP